MVDNRATSDDAETERTDALPSGAGEDAGDGAGDEGAEADTASGGAPDDDSTD